ncbi:hypothetical protein ACLOJK_010765 [Asimina triloba]
MQRWAAAGFMRRAAASTTSFSSDHGGNGVDRPPSRQESSASPNLIFGDGENPAKATASHNRSRFTSLLTSQWHDLATISSIPSRIDSLDPIRSHGSVSSTFNRQ